MASVSGTMAGYDMTTIRPLNGVLSDQQPNTFALSGEGRVGRFFGNFTHEGGTPRGVITHYNEVQGDKLWLASGISVDASEVLTPAGANVQLIFGPVGLRGNDTLIGSDGNDVRFGYGGNDRFTYSFGIDQMDGGAGLDVVEIIGRRSEFAYQANGNTASVTGPRIAYSLVDVERIKFMDSSVAFDISGNAGQVYRLYQAAFDRMPDQAGVGYWINRIDNGAKLVDIAAFFAGSAEFQSKNGATSSSAFIDVLYRNVLDRPADPAGAAFWLGQLNQGQTRADVLLGFSESPENQANVIGVISNGIVYDHF